MGWCASGVFVHASSVFVLSCWNLKKWPNAGHLSVAPG
jgi:hypothetical protein